MWEIGEEFNGWRVVWITGWELHLDVEHSIFEGSLFRAPDICVPGEEICLERSCSHTNSRDLFIFNFLEILH
jgi:hypothetical protein